MFSHSNERKLSTTKIAERQRIGIQTDSRTDGQIVWDAVQQNRWEIKMHQQQQQKMEEKAGYTKITAIPGNRTGKGNDF